MKKYKPTISAEILMNDGYTRWSDPEEGRTLYQKKVTDEKGIKFFINCCHDIFNIPNKQEPKSWWTFSIQFEIEEGLSVDIRTTQWFNEDGIYSGKNHLHAEEYLEKMWILNGNPYYGKNEEEEKKNE